MSINCCFSDGLSSNMHSMNLRGNTPKILTNPEKGEQDIHNTIPFVSHTRDMLTSPRIIRFIYTPIYTTYLMDNNINHS